jgi:hypothetical protein
MHALFADDDAKQHDMQPWSQYVELNAGDGAVTERAPKRPHAAPAVYGACWAEPHRRCDAFGAAAGDLFNLQVGCLLVRCGMCNGAKGTLQVAASLQPTMLRQSQCQHQRRGRRAKQDWVYIAGCLLLSYHPQLPCCP